MAPVEPFAKAQQQILGEAHAYPMVSYGTQKVSAAWKLYSKSQGVPAEIANAVSKQIKKYESALDHADEEDRDEIDINDYIGEEYVEIFEKSAEHRGVIASWSIAPCSYLLYQKDIRKKIGLVNIKDHLCCLMDKNWAETCHFLKNDVLKVSVVELIYKTFERIGMPVPSEKELRKMCAPDDLCWKMYSTGCTIGLNQVEKVGTSARVGKYKPTNISELCAFVAAIRPGFKSMYKIFESRSPFEYDVSAFDKLLQTPEMPNSFVLYQEQEMLALNYAGIPMSECYTAIKNIAKKRVEKVLAYKEQFIEGFKKSIIENDGKPEDVAKTLSRELWQIVEDSSKYSFNACLDGRTRLKGNAAGDYKNNVTIEEMFFIKHSLDYARLIGREDLHWQYNAYGYGSAYSMFPDHTVKLNDIVNIQPAGYRERYTVVTKNAHTIVCTDNHKFPTPSGMKRLDELKVGDKVYVIPYDEDVVIAVEEEIIDISLDPREEMTYDVEMADPAHTIVSESGLVASNSHSYCVSCDSLYSAWAKAHHPYEFYETLLNIYEAKGNKDKINAAKDEAENYFSIRFPPFRFGQDNRTIRADPDKKSIYNSIASIKGYSKSAGELLYECSQQEHPNFFSILSWLNEKSFKSAKIKPLIKIDYFQDFGNCVELDMLTDIYDFFKQGAAKSVAKDKVKGWLTDIIPSYATGTTKAGKEAKSWSITDMPGLLKSCEDYILSLHVEDMSYKNKAENQNEILGYVDLTTGKEEDRKKLFILDCFELPDRFRGGIWKYKIKAKSIGSGKTSSWDIDPRTMKHHPIKKGSIIDVGEWAKDKKGYLNLYTYRVLIDI